LIFGTIVVMLRRHLGSSGGHAGSAAIEDRLRRPARVRKGRMRMSVYRVIDVIGTSSESWEDAAATAIKTASQSVRDLRVGEVVEQDIHVAEDGSLSYRTKLRLSFKYETP
jgi:flavin-binding protein dodecin